MCHLTDPKSWTRHWKLGCQSWGSVPRPGQKWLTLYITLQVGSPSTPGRRGRSALSDKLRLNSGPWILHSANQGVRVQPGRWQAARTQSSSCTLAVMFPTPLSSPVRKSKPAAELSSHSQDTRKNFGGWPKPERVTRVVTSSRVTVGLLVGKLSSQSGKLLLWGGNLPSKSHMSSVRPCSSHCLCHHSEGDWGSRDRRRELRATGKARVGGLTCPTNVQA